MEKFCSSCGNTIKPYRLTCPICGFDFSPEVRMLLDDKVKIEVLFNEFFPSSNVYGEQILHVGGGAGDSMVNNIWWHQFTDGELPLLLFNYAKSNMEKGFILTNKSIIWEYGSSSGGFEFLVDIEDVVIERALLAKVMNLKVDYDRQKKSSKIFLTGIRNENEFVSTFKKFIKAVREFCR